MCFLNKTKEFSSYDESSSKVGNKFDTFKCFSNPLFELDEEIITLEKDVFQNEVISNQEKINDTCETEGDLKFFDDLLNENLLPPDVSNVENDFQDNEEEIDISCDMIPPGIDTDDDSGGDVEPVEVMFNYSHTYGENISQVERKFLSMVDDLFNLSNDDETFDPGGVTLENLYPMDDEPMWLLTVLSLRLSVPQSLFLKLLTNLLSKNLKTKFDRLADKQSGRPSGSLPSNTQPNPKGHNSKAYQLPQSRNEHVNVVFTRRGKSYNPPVNQNDQQNDSENLINFDSDDEDEESTPQPKTQNPKPVKETPLPKSYKPKIPFPQRLRKEKMEAQYRKFLDMICTVRINVPLIDVLARMPNYGKFLKELISNKHKIEQISAAFLSDETDLGASINLMPYSLYAKLSLDTAYTTKMTMKHYYCNNDDTCFSIDVINEILEENFDALLDEGSKILHSIEGTLLEEEIFAEFDEFMAMTVDENSDSEFDTEDAPFKKITINTNYKIKTSLEDPPTDLELKPLPDNLEYIFLEEPSFLPVIISSQLSKEKKSKLISVLKKHNQAFA
ncbi:hypothetical protein Tco_1237671 [Tanacetum coccineum]